MKTSVLGISFLAVMLWTCTPEGVDTPAPDAGDPPREDNEVPDLGNSYAELPVRQGPTPETTDGIPHVQIGVERVEEVHAEMLEKVYGIPDVEDVPSVISGWQGIALSEGVTIRVPDALIGGREFAHIHDDGSLHIFLEPKRDREAVEAGWAVDHPFAVQNQLGWEGFVMLYTPQTLEELDVTFRLIVDGYNFVTGRNY